MPPVTATTGSSNIAAEDYGMMLLSDYLVHSLACTWYTLTGKIKCANTANKKYAMVVD